MSTKDADKEAKEAPAAKAEVSITEKVLSTGIRVGTVVKTKAMAQFVNRTTPDGLHIIDISKTLARIETVSRLISRADINRVVVYSAREYGKTPVEKFCELTGAIPITGRFMPGTFTNPLYPNHIEPEIVLVSDPALDTQAVDEASKMGVPIIAICDTDNVPSKVDLIIPANNRGRKALAAVFWLLARAVLIRTGRLTSAQPMKYGIEDFETKLMEEEKSA